MTNRRNNTGTDAGQEDPNGKLDNQRNTEGQDQSTDQLGAQVKPETQLTEDDGNRSLAKPKTDPGPVLGFNGDGDKVGQASDFQFGNRDNGHAPIHKLNKPHDVVRRGSTTPPHFAREEILTDHKMSADLAIHGGASDMYNKEGRNNDGINPVRDYAERNREIAPKDRGADDPFAQSSVVDN